jgi:hypothetical protein
VNSGNVHELRILSVCLVREWREWSGANPLLWLFGWGAAGVERLLREHTREMRVRFVHPISRDGAIPLPFLLSRLPLLFRECNEGGGSVLFPRTEPVRAVATVELAPNSPRPELTLRACMAVAERRWQ